ncbi:MAG: class I SAM-dependent methyltransferase [Myxococcota bacterium]
MASVRLTPEKLPVMLGPVQETLLVPLLGRALETEKSSGLIDDPKAVEIVKSLDYDFEKWRGTSTLMAATIRTLMYDHEVSNFLKAHPEGTVVEIGCGLNTRFERLDNGSAHWFELDLPDSMALRRRFFQEQERRTMIAASFLEPSWYDQVHSTQGPWLFVSEAVIIYIEANAVERALRSLAGRFPGAQLLMDTTSTRMVDRQSRHDVMKTLPKDSWFRWKCDEPRALSAWGLKLIRSKTFLDAEPELVDRFPLLYRVVTRWAPWLIRSQASDYKINLFELAPKA